MVVTTARAMTKVARATVAGATRMTATMRAADNNATTNHIGGRTVQNQGIKRQKMYKKTLPVDRA